MRTVDKATHFIGHGQGEYIVELTVGGIKTFLLQNPQIDPMTSLSRLNCLSLGQNAKGEFGPTQIAKLIATIKNTVFLAEPWNTPNAITRVFCVCEVKETLVSLTVQLPLDEVVNAQRALKENPENINSIVVDVEYAGGKAEILEDLRTSALQSVAARRAPPSTAEDDLQYEQQLLEATERRFEECPRARQLPAPSWSTIQ